MTRAEIIAALKKDRMFCIQELVCPHTYKRDGELAWRYLTTELLHTLLVLRTDILNVPLTCNNYHITGGKLTQRGLRCNLCPEVRQRTDNNVLYLSAHVAGCALDLSSTRMTAEEMLQRIKANSHKLPYNVRIEEGVKWLHIDTYDMGVKVFTFKP